MYVSTTVCSYFTANCGDYCVVLHPNAVPFSHLLFGFGSVCKQTKVFLFCMLKEKINYIKECIRLDSCKGKKALLFAPG